MGKKKAKPNGFFGFVIQFIKAERDAGRKHPKDQWAAVAGPHWERLSQAEKDSFNARSKRQPANTGQKRTSQGIPLEVIERENQERVDKRKYMEISIKNWCTTSTGIASKPMTFIMANYFYKSLHYSPAEIAIGKFTLENGLEKCYHSFVNPDVVEIGYAALAKDNAHLIPPPRTSNAMGEKDYAKTYADLLDVLGINATETYEKGDVCRPCVYTRKSNIEMIESILDQLSVDSEWRKKFDVFELELLFNEMKNAYAAPNQPLPIAVTTHFIELDPFSFTPDIACNFHVEADVPNHCALSYIRRWFFMFANHLIAEASIVPGVHLPKNLFTNENRETSQRVQGADNSLSGYARMTEDISSESDSDF